MRIPLACSFVPAAAAADDPKLASLAVIATGGMGWPIAGLAAAAGAKESATAAVEPT